MYRVFVVIIALLIFFILPASAQNKNSACSSKIKALQEEISIVRAELSACQKAVKEQSADVQRSEAIASLKAIQSALDTGANLQEFKKYQIESRIKVDALPDIPENLVIKEISDLYKDAVTFGIMRITGTISESELEEFRLKYNNDYLLKQLEKMDPKLLPQGRRHEENQAVLEQLKEMKPNYKSQGLRHDLNQLDAGAISQRLIVLADLELSLSKLK